MREKSEIRNPKSEGFNALDTGLGRNLNFPVLTGVERDPPISDFGFRISGFPSDFGFRISGL
jgi:hypothetical protein